MATPAQIAANRQNALHSTGPRTQDGKAKVAQNRVTHGLTGRHVILPGEDPAEYDLLLAEFAADLRPVGPIQRFLVEQVAQAEWRLIRIAKMEADIFHRGIQAERSAGAVFENDCAGSNWLMKLLRYETVARRAFYQALDCLRRLQAPPPAERAWRAPGRPPAPEIRNYDSKPIPAAPEPKAADLQGPSRELPLVDPIRGAKHVEFCMG